MGSKILLIASALLLIGNSFAAINFTGDVSVDFDENSIVFNDANGEGDVSKPGGITSTGWDFLRSFFHYDRDLDRLYVGLDFNGRICGDADGNGNPGTTGTVLAGLGGTDVANLGTGETVCVFFNTDLDGDFDVIAGVKRYGDYTQFVVANCTGDPNTDPSNSFGTPIASASLSALYICPDAAHPDFEFYIDNFSELPGFNYDVDEEDCIFRMGAYAGSWSDASIGFDKLNNSQLTVTFFSLTTIPHEVPRDLYVMQGLPVFVDDGDPTVVFGPSLNNSPIGWPYWRVSRWNVELQTYERWGETNWPIPVGGNPPEQDPGKGFWWVQDLIDDCQIEVTGYTIDPGWVVFQSLQEPMTGGRKGLNQMANPFEVPVTWGDAYLRDDPYGGITLQIEDAVAQGKVVRYAVTWDPYGLEYITNDFGYSIPPWMGFWFQQLQMDYDYTLCFTKPWTTDSEVSNQYYGGGVPRDIDEYGEWSFSIGVCSDSYELADFGNFIGISADASDEWDQYDAVEYAPQFAPNGYYHLYFPHDNWEENPGAYCFDFRQGPFEYQKIWDFTVRAEDFSGEIKLAWDGVAKAYPEYNVSLLNAQGTILIPSLLDAEYYSFYIQDGQEIDFKIRVINTLGVEEPGTVQPNEFKLNPAYPNPFNNSTKLSLTLPSAAKVKLALYSIDGRLAQKVFENSLSAGAHSIDFTAENLPSGIYLLRASADGKEFASQKLVLLK